MFLPVGETTVIDRIFRELESDNRIKEVFVSTNERFALDFDQYLAESEFEKPILSVEKTTEEDEKFGVVGALAQLVNREGIDDDLLVIAGDNLIGFDLTDFVDFFEAKTGPVLAAYDVGSKELARSYGLVELDGDVVVDFQEKPNDPNSTLVSIACYAFPRESLQFDAYLNGGNNPDEPGWFIQWLVSREPVSAFAFDEAWFDIGTPGSYLEAVSWALDGEAVVAESATVRGSEIDGDSHIMDGAHVENSVVHGSVVFPGATVVDSEVHDTIIDEETTVENMDLAGALIGAHTQLTNED
jgi:glucose-1-phosphate thymidylyltransferase